MDQKTYFILKHVSPHTCGLFFLEEVNGLSSPYIIVNTIQFQENTTKGLAWVRFAEVKSSALHWGGLFTESACVQHSGTWLSGSWLNKHVLFSAVFLLLYSAQHIQNTTNTGLVSWSKCTTISNMKHCPLDKWLLDCSSCGHNVTGEAYTSWCWWSTTGRSGKPHLLSASLLWTIFWRSNSKLFFMFI